MNSASSTAAPDVERSDPEPRAPAQLIKIRRASIPGSHQHFAQVGRWDDDLVALAVERLNEVVVRCKVFTLDNRLLVRRIGRLGAADATGVAERLRQAFA